MKEFSIIADMLCLTMATIIAIWTYLDKRDNTHTNQRERIIRMLYAILLLLLVKI